MVYYAEVKTLAALRASADSYFLIERKRELERSKPETAFYALLFREAATAYGSLRTRSDDRRTEISAAQGEAFSFFAYGEDSGTAFERLATLVGPNTPLHATILGLFLAYLPSDEAARLGDVASWRARVVNALGR